MHRQTDYAYQVPSETDFLYAQRFAYEGLGLLAMDLLGTTALVAGLACTATGPTSLNVNIGPGRIYSKQNLEDTAWGLFNAVGGLAADTTADHQIIKQGLFRDTAAFSCPAPGTTGQSINYLIEASFSEVDAVPISLPFVSATAPYPPIAPNALNTVRQDKCVITVKAGTAATTGSQTTPSVDAGNVGLYVVTVANGQTAITSSNFSVYSGAPFISETLTQKISQATADLRYLQGGTLGLGQCRLSVASATSLKLSPYQGNLININGTLQAIPSAGVSITNTGLAANTLYYAYAYMNSGTMTLEFSTTVHATSATTGVETKSGDATRTLVGMIYTSANTPGQFVDSAAQRFCANWFNRRIVYGMGGGVTTTDTNTALHDVSPANHAQFITWPSSVAGSLQATVGSTSGAQQVDIGLGFDGVGTSVLQNYFAGSAGQNYNGSISDFVTSLTEGFHYLTAAGSCQIGDTGIYNVTNTIVKLFI